MKDNKTWSSKADRPELDGGIQYHIRCAPGDIAKIVLLPGDPDRVPKISADWDSFEEKGRNREHVTHTGIFEGVAISACSTGAGGGSTASAMEGLASIGAETFIRVGTTSGIQEGIKPGDLIISTGAVRYDGTSENYVAINYPAVADYEVNLALIEACEKLGFTYHLGITATTASFFCGQNRDGFGGYRQSWFETRYEDLRRANVINYEMEAATVLTLANLFKLRAGAVFTAIGNRVTNEFSYEGIDKSIQVASLAAVILDGWDKKKKEKGKKYYYPSL
ncbi:MAG: nucleoside phosphorylase [Gudongella sp.]|nr:nucleoside phosphorylase [Gudongella sp.]